MASESEEVAEALEQYDNVVDAAVVGDEVCIEYSGSHRIAVFSEAAEHGYVADSVSTSQSNDSTEIYFVKASQADLSPSVETEVTY